MNAKPRAVVLSALFGVGLWTGCGPKPAEKKTSESERIELEQRALRETKAGNDAITEMNRKLGRKVTPVDLGVTPTPTPKL